MTDTPFEHALIGEIIPFIDANFRTLADQPHRALAGLSMGGNQTLNIAIPHLDKFAYIGVFSSGIITPGRGAAPAAETPAAPFGEAWEKQNLAALDNAAGKRGLNLLWGVPTRLQFPH